MKKVPALLLALGCALSLCAAPPASLDGLVYRDQTGLSGLRTFSLLSVDVSSAGSFQTILSQTGSTISGRLPDYSSPASGTYTYSATGERDYLLVLNASATSRDELSLHFDTDDSGTVARRHFESGVAQTTTPFTGSFWLQPRPDDSRHSLVNVSTRLVAKSGAPAIIGFVISGAHARDVLIRVVGPALSTFGVTDAWANPRFHFPRTFGLFSDDLQSLHAGTWSSTPAAQATNERAFARAGAFSLTAGSKDLADVVRLFPGVYSITVDPDSTNEGGTVLVEVYDL